MKSLKCDIMKKERLNYEIYKDDEVNIKQNLK